MVNVTLHHFPIDYRALKSTFCTMFSSFTHTLQADVSLGLVPLGVGTDIGTGIGVADSGDGGRAHGPAGGGSARGRC